jgi:heme exporter protein B
LCSPPYWRRRDLPLSRCRTLLATAFACRPQIRVPFSSARRLLEAALLMGLVTVYGFHVEHPVVLVLSAVTASIGIAAAGVLYATIAASLRVRDTLVPLLMLPALAPVALGGTRAWVAAQAVGPGDGLRWVQLLAVFASLFTAFGIAAYGSLIEEG